MRIIKYDYSGKDELYKGARVLTKVTFASFNDRLEVIKEAGNDVGKIKDWFDKLSIKYDDIRISGNNVIYCTDENELLLADLSSGERYMLYLLACKESNKKIVAESLFERLGSVLREAAEKNLRDYENLVVVLYNTWAPAGLKDCVVG